MTWASRRADVVLNDETSARADDGGVKAGVVEFEAARAVNTAHEGFDHRFVARQNAMGLRASDIFLGARRS
jgi:hypothetical protein